uniref:Uncharacterized protein n=1 Tax=Anguilla anguilla TaxID=7936 RepID=A0A0E9WHG8_ANGAN
MDVRHDILSLTFRDRLWVLSKCIQFNNMSISNSQNMVKIVFYNARQ